MKVFLLIFLLVFVLLPAKGQKNDIDTFITHLQGSIKRMEIISFKTDNKGNDIINDYYDSTYFYFDENGTLLKKEESKYDGTPQCIFLYHYNEKGYFSEIQSKCCRSKENWHYVFNKNGLKVYEKYENNKSFQLYHKKDSLFESCPSTRRSNYLYNEKELLIQQKTSFFNCDTLYKKKTVKYFYQKNKLTHYKVYNDRFINNNLTESDSVIIRAEIPLKDDQVYETQYTKFDSLGNWIEKMMFIDNLPVARTYRNIKYNK